MGLRGTAAGGYSFALPQGYDDTADLSVFLWMRRGSGAANGARIFSLINAARTRGFTIHLGGTVTGAGSASDVVVSVGSTRDTIWGADDHDGRGRAILPGLSTTAFHALAFSVRGSAAADNTAASGAQQLQDVWWQGVAAGATQTSIGSGIAAQGGRAYLLCREAGNLAAFNGWVAEVAVWQGHRLTEAQALLLARGASPLWVQPDKLLFHRSFRTGLAAEVGDAPLATLGGGGSLETQAHPTLLIESAHAAHAGASLSPDMTPAQAAASHLWPGQGAMAHAARPAPLTVTGAPPLAAAPARHSLGGDGAALTAAGRVQPQGRALAMRSGTPGLLPLADTMPDAAEVMRVPPEVRLTTAGIF